MKCAPWIQIRKRVREREREWILLKNQSISAQVKISKIIKYLLSENVIWKPATQYNNNNTRKKHGVEFMFFIPIKVQCLKFLKVFNSNCEQKLREFFRSFHEFIALIQIFWWWRSIVSFITIKQTFYYPIVSFMKSSDNIIINKIND